MIKRAIEKLQQEIKQQLLQAYQLFDNRNKGYIDEAALTESFKSLGFKFSSQQIRDMIKHIDDNGKGVITKDAFRTLLTCRLDISDSQDQLRRAFQYYDNSGRGKIQYRDLYRVGEELGQDKAIVPSIMIEADKDQDGSINYEEFKRVIKKTGYFI